MSPTSPHHGQGLTDSLFLLLARSLLDLLLLVHYILAFVVILSTARYILQSSCFIILIDSFPRPNRFITYKSGTFFWIQQLVILAKLIFDTRTGFGNLFLRNSSSKLVLLDVKTFLEMAELIVS